MTDMRDGPWSRSSVVTSSDHSVNYLCTAGLQVFVAKWKVCTLDSHLELVGKLNLLWHFICLSYLYVILENNMTSS